MKSSSDTRGLWLAGLALVRMRQADLLGAWQALGKARTLDPTDPTKTVEGYPAPTRAAVLARRPS